MNSSLGLGGPLEVKEGQIIVPTDEALQSMDEMSSYYPATDQNANTFLTDLSWEDWLSSGSMTDPGFNMPQDLPLSDNSASRCLSLDSNALSDQLSCQGWPGNFPEDPQFDFASCPERKLQQGIEFCPQRTPQQDIETCIPQLPQLSPIEIPPSTTTTPNEESPPAKLKNSLSPTKRKHGSRIKLENPLKVPLTKDLKLKPIASTRTAHSVIEHNYRQNLNLKMEQLRQILSTVDATTTKHVSNEEKIEEDDDIPFGLEDNKALSSTSKTRKSDILLHAYGYIKRAEREKKRMLDENAFLKGRVVALERLVGCEDCGLLKEMSRLQMSGGGMMRDSEAFMSART